MAHDLPCSEPNFCASQAVTKEDVICVAIRLEHA